jgi:enamine deaminase RidA (YjgF/YER057c/UK114 family)
VRRQERRHAAAGGRCWRTSADVVALTHHVADIGAFMGTGDIRRGFFAAPCPATATVQVAALHRPELLVEITTIAGVPRERFKRPADAARA